jgi:hypothetical protein
MYFEKSNSYNCTAFFRKILKIKSIWSELMIVSFSEPFKSNAKSEMCVGNE